jgi:predicted phosphodiesterase
MGKRGRTVRRVRVAVLADIHGNLPALEAVLREVDAAGADAIMLAGDMTVGPPSDTEALALFSDWAKRRRSE